MKPVLSAVDISKSYGSGTTRVDALKAVNFDLYPSELVVLLGASGSGKSTLLNIMGGLDTPTSGEIIHEGMNLCDATEQQLTEYRRLYVGFVFQFYNLVPSLTALENVALVTEIASKPLSPKDALSLVGLEERIDHFPSQLSGGEQQRVAIARAIAKQPQILLCDEPTGALDQHTGIVVLKAIENINRELGTSTVVITHNAIVADMADRVVSISDGEIAGISRNTERKPADQLAW